MTALIGVRSSWRMLASRALWTWPPSATTPGSSSSRTGGCSATRAQQRLDLLEQAWELNRFGVVVVAAGRQRFVAIARHGVRRQGDDRNRARLRRRLELPGRLPAVQDGQAHVHQDQVGCLGAGEVHPLLPVNGDDNLVAAPLQPTREHVAVHLIVLDQQELHATSSATLCDYHTPRRS